MARQPPFEWLARAGLVARGVIEGPVLLGAVAFGLLGFALYSVLDARYRRV